MTNYQVVMIPTSDIFIDEDLNEARGKILPMDVADLANDIEKQGLLSPIHVQASTKVVGKKFRVVAGNRRLTAIRVKQIKETPCFVVDPNMNELAVRAINLKENLLRKELDIVQEAIGIKPYVVASWREETIAEEFNQSRGWVQVRKIILGLPKDIQEELRGGLLNQGLIRKLGSFRDEKDQYKFIREAKDHRMKGEKIKLPTNVRPPNPEAKRVRKPEEMFSMIEYLIELHGESSLATRCLAWASGQVNDLELAAEVRKDCEERGIDYEPHDSVAYVPT